MKKLLIAVYLVGLGMSSVCQAQIAVPAGKLGSRQSDRSTAEMLEQNRAATTAQHMAVMKELEERVIVRDMELRDGTKIRGKYRNKKNNIVTWTDLGGKEHKQSFKDFSEKSQKLFRDIHSGAEARRLQAERIKVEKAAKIASKQPIVKK